MRNKLQTGIDGKNHVGSGLGFLHPDVFNNAPEAVRITRREPGLPAS